MSAYELYLVFHITAAIVWIGAGLALTLLATRATTARDLDRMLAFARDAEWLGLRLFLPANLVVLVSAVLLVREGDWGFGPLWIRLGVVGFAVSFLAGVVFFAPGWSRAARSAADGRGVRSVEAAVRLLLFGSWLDVGWLLAVVYVMAVKPEPGEWTALGIAGAIPAVFALAAFTLLRRPIRESASEAVAERSAV
jgi:hypothetical protein